MSAASLQSAKRAEGQRFGPSVVSCEKCVEQHGALEKSLSVSRQPFPTALLHLHRSDQL
jgi:ribosomal protein S14